LNALTIRDLSVDEIEALKNIAEFFNLPTSYSGATESKVIRATVHCNICNSNIVQYIKIDKYGDNVWLMDRKELNVNKAKASESFNTNVPYCSNCIRIKIPQEHRAADFYHAIITNQYANLLKIYHARGITKDAIFSTIKASAMRIAQCYRRPDTWKDYVPKAIRDKMKEDML
jgi:hypothetical protein